MRALNSVVFRKIEKRIKKRVEVVDGVKANVATHRKRLEQLGDLLSGGELNEIANQLDSIQISVDSLELDGIKEEGENVEAKLAKIEEKRDQQAILSRGRIVEDPEPEKSSSQQEERSGGGPPSLQPEPGRGGGPPSLQPEPGSGGGPPSLQPEKVETPKPRLPVQTQPSEPQQFNLSDLDHRNRLVTLLTHQKDKTTISIIEVTIGE